MVVIKMRTLIIIESNAEPLLRWLGREKEVENKLRLDLDIPNNDKVSVQFLGHRERIKVEE